MLYEDNTGAIALAETGHFKGRSKHFDLRFKWVVDMLDLGLFKLDHVSSPDQHADTGTTARAAPAIQKVVAAIYGRQLHDCYRRSGRQLVVGRQRHRNQVGLSRYRRALHDRLGAESRRRAWQRALGRAVGFVCALGARRRIFAITISCLVTLIIVRILT